MWDSLQDLFLTLMNKQLVRGYEVEQCYIGALGSVTDEVRCLQERCYSKRFSLLFVCLFVCLLSPLFAHLLQGIGLPPGRKRYIIDRKSFICKLFSVGSFCIFLCFPSED